VEPTAAPNATATPTPTPKPTPGFEIAFALVSLGAVAIASRKLK
jgi:PGF-CTERM protein